MAIGRTIDVSDAFATGGPGFANIDCTGYDRAVVQLVAPAAAVNFLGSNDDGGQTGTIPGSPTVAGNFTALFMTNLATGVGATSGSVAGLWASNLMPRLLQLSGTTATKVLVYLSKIS